MPTKIIKILLREILMKKYGRQVKNSNKPAKYLTIFMQKIYNINRNEKG